MAPVESLLLLTLLALAAGAPAEPPAEPSVDDLLRLFNVSRQQLEASRQQLAAHPPPNARPPGPLHLPGAADGPASSAQQAMRNRYVPLSGERCEAAPGAEDTLTKRQLCRSRSGPGEHSANKSTR